MAKKNQNPGADQEAGATAPGAASESENKNDMAEENTSNENADATEENSQQESSGGANGDAETENTEQSDFNLEKYGLTREDVKCGVEHTDLRNGKSLFWADIPDGGKLAARINGKETLLEFNSCLAVYANGGSFKFYPSIEIV